MDNRTPLTPEEELSALVGWLEWAATRYAGIPSPSMVRWVEERLATLDRERDESLRRGEALNRALIERDDARDAEREARERRERVDPDPEWTVMDAATKDADLLAAAFAKTHGLSGLPTPDVAMDVWRDIARDYAVARLHRGQDLPPRERVDPDPSGLAVEAEALLADITAKVASNRSWAQFYSRIMDLLARVAVHSPRERVDPDLRAQATALREIILELHRIRGRMTKVTVADFAAAILAATEAPREPETCHECGEPVDGHEHDGYGRRLERAATPDHTEVEEEQIDVERLAQAIRNINLVNFAEAAPAIAAEYARLTAPTTPRPR